MQERTKGELKLKLFPDSTLGNAQAMISGVRGGTIDMEMSGSNNFAGLSPVMNLLDVPFLFRDTAHAHKTLDGKVGDDLKASLEGKGLKVLAYWENGWRDATNSRAPVKTPADLKGLKIRTNNSPMNIAAFKVFGANPIPMPFAEVYTGLETRTIDAQEHPINVVWSAKFFEVQKYLSLTHHAYSPLLVVINKAKFDGLSPEFQQALISSAQEAGTPVAGGLFDVVSTALCAGIEDEFTLNAVMGTWAVTSGITRGLRDGEAHPYVYGRYVNDGEFIVHEASPTSSGNLEWFTAQWGEISFDEINQAVASLPKAGGDLFFLPFLYGSNAGLEMTSGFYGMQAIHTRAHLLQAIYEGVVFSHMTHFNRMRERFTDVHTLRVTGGPAHSDVWMQMLADVSGLRIELPQVEETGCFGAALAARVGTGVYRDFSEAQRDLQHPVRTLLPDMTAHQLYQQKYQRYQHLIAALQGFHARIKEHTL